MAIVAVALIVGRRAAVTPALACLAGVALVSGPWLLFAGMRAVSAGDFLAVGAGALAAGAVRLPELVGWAGHELVRWRWAFLWPAVGGAALLSGRPRLDRSAFPLLVAVVYITGVVAVYMLSDYELLAQHVATSYFRLVGQVAALPLIWLGARATRETV